MPVVRTRNSTERCLDLADFIDNFGDIMVQKMQQLCQTQPCVQGAPPVRQMQPLQPHEPAL